LSLDNLEIADDEAIVERDRAERFEPLPWFIHELDPHLGDFHVRSPYNGGLAARQDAVANTVPTFHDESRRATLRACRAELVRPKYAEPLPVIR
jgi:hypothetical protein